MNRASPARALGVRAAGLGLLLVGCGGEPTFDLEAYCDGYATCADDATTAQCIADWEAQRDEAPACRDPLDTYEACLAREDWDCRFGSWGASGCVAEATAFTECLIGALATEPT